MSIRDAAESDIPVVVAMGRRFFDASEYRGEYSPETMAATCRMLIESLRGILIVTDRLDGMAGALVFPLYMTGDLAAQEFFWWSEGRDGMALLPALEGRGRALGAQTITMVALDSLRPAAVGALYERRGYRLLEHNYVKEL